MCVYLWMGGRTQRVVCWCICVSQTISTIVYIWRAFAVHTQGRYHGAHSNAKVTLFAAFAYCTNLITLTFFSKGVLFPSLSSPLSENPTDCSFCFAIIAKDFHFFHCHYSPLRTFAYRFCVCVYFSYMIEESCSALISCKIKVFYNLRTILHNINFYSFTFCALVVFSVFL